MSFRPRSCNTKHFNSRERRRKTNIKSQKWNQMNQMQTTSGQLFMMFLDTFVIIMIIVLPFRNFITVNENSSRQSPNRFWIEWRCLLIEPIEFLDSAHSLKYLLLKLKLTTIFQFADWLERYFVIWCNSMTDATALFDIFKWN